MGFRIVTGGRSRPSCVYPAGADGARRHALLASWYRSVREVPAWVDWEQLERGQQVFTVNAPAAALSLYYLSLVGGFSAPLITRVLRATAYLTAPPKKVMRRLVDTGAMVAACTTGGAASLRPGGAGWTAVLQVRVLHAKVRLPGFFSIFPVLPWTSGRGL